MPGSQIITGTVEAGASVSVTVTVGATSTSGFATVTGTTWNYTATFPGEGTNTVSVTARDNAGNSKTLSVAILYDRTPPTATVSGMPPAGSTVNSTTARLTVGGADVVSYRYRLDASGLNPDAPVSTPITLSGLADGSHSVYVFGIDAAGNVQAAATSYTWTVDTVPPTLVLNPIATPTNVSAPGINGTLSAGAGVMVSLNGGAPSAATVTGTNWTYTLPALSLGANSVVVTARDSAGNIATTSAPIVYSVAIPVAGLAGVASNGTPITNGATVTTNSALFTVSGAGVIQYQWKLDGGLWQKPGGQNGYDISTPLSLTGLADGSHTLNVIGVDAAGNLQPSGSPTSVTWTVDSTPPTVVVTGPSGSVPSPNADFNVDPTGIVSYKYALDNGSYSAEILVGSGTSIHLTALAEGPHTLFVIGKDNSGNWQKNPTMASWKVDTTNPVITINTPASPTKSGFVSGTVEKGITNIILRVDHGAVTGSNITVPTGSIVGTTWSHTIPTTNFVNGANTIVATATDSAGNSQSASVGVVFDNVLPVLTVTGPWAENTIVGTTSAVFTVSADETLATYNYKLDSGSYSADIPAGTPIVLTGLSAGTTATPTTHTVSVQATDLAGNKQTSAKTFTWKVNGDLLATTLSGTPAPSPTNSAGATLTVGGAGVTAYQYKLDSGGYSAEIPIASPTITLAGLADGPHTVSVLGKDGSGNWQGSPTTTAWVVDTTAPLKTEITLSGIPASGSTNASTLILTVGGRDVVSYRYYLTANPGGTVVSPTQNADSTVATVINFTALPEGSYSVAVIGRDTAGNWQVDPATPGGWWNSANATTASFTVDRTPPTLTLDPVTSPTNVINQTLGGTSSGATTITVSTSTAAIGGSIPAAANWTFPVQGLVSGANIITIVATDAAGNTATQTATITLGTALPAATISGVPATFTPQQTATLNVAGTGVVAYRYRLDGGALTPVPPAENLKAVPISLAGLANGLHTVAVYGRDDAGNWQESPTVASWTVDTVAPVPTVTPASPATPTNARTAVFTVGGTDVVSYQYKLDSTTTPGSYSAEAPVSTKISLSNLTDSNYTLSVLGKDLAGNWSAVPVTAAWTVQTAAPALTLATIATPTALTDIPLSGTVTSGASVTVSNTTNNSSTTVTVTGTNWASGANLPLAPGINTIVVTATDTLGNTASTTIQVNRFAVLPTAVVSGTPPFLTSLQSFTMTVGGSSVVAYKYRLDGGAWTGETPVATPITLALLGDGLHKLEVVAKDMAGAWQADPAATVVQWTIDSVPPTVTFNPVATPTAAPSQLLTGTTEAGAVIRVAFNTTAVCSSVSYPTAATWQCTASAFSSGSNLVTVTATDPAGNVSSATASIVFDAAPPVATLSGAPSGSTRKTDAALLVGGTDVVAYRYSIDNAAFLPAPPAAGVPVSAPISLAGLADGSHTVKVVGIKASGAEQSQSSPTTASWTVDTVPPIAVLSGLPPGQTNRTVTDITVGPADVQSYRYSLDSGLYSAETPVSTKIALAGLSAGPHTLSVVAKDAAGNWQTDATTHSWTIDLTPPSLSLDTVTTPTVFPSQTIKGSMETGAAVAVSASTAASCSSISHPTATSWSCFLSGMVNGPNDITVTATDAAGNSSSVTATINLYTPPAAVISGVPVSPTNATSATLTVGGTDVVAYRYSIDAGPFGNETLVSSPIILTQLAEGVHILQVIGRDTAGVWQVTASQASWTVDLTPPAGVTLANTPLSPTNITSAAITVSGADVAYYKYRLDSGDYSGFVGVDVPITLSGLSDAPHSIKVLGRDQAGNVQDSAAPTTFTWTVDTIAPATAPSPLPGTYNSTQSVRLIANEPATIHYTTDGSNPTVSSPIYTAPLTINVNRTIRFFAVDLAGNIEPTKTATYSLISNGDFNGDGVIDISDAVLALRVAASLRKPTADEILRGDVAPLVDHRPRPDGVIDISDVVIILQRVVGMAQW